MKVMQAMVAGVALMLLGTGVQAAPFVNVTAGWSASALGFTSDPGGALSNLPSGLIGGCAGDGCSVTRSITLTGLDVSDSRSAAGSFVLSNNGFHGSGYVVVSIEYSAYLPSSLGASVDDPITQIAEFSSFVQGGADDWLFSDQQSCTTTASTPACGVDAADSSQLTVYVAVPEDGEASEIPFVLGIAASIIDPPASVPEPATIALLLTGIAGIGLARRRR